MVSTSQADAASLAKGVLVPNRTTVLTIHETADRPGSSERTRDLVLALRAKLRQELVKQGV